MENISPAEFLSGMKKSCKLASSILKEVSQKVKVGTQTNEIDKWVHEMTLEAGAYPSPLNYPHAPTNPRKPKIDKGGFPKSVCTSINEVVCHGIPSETVLKDGDIVNIDVTGTLDGYFGDTSQMVIVGRPSETAKKIVEVAQECRRLGIEAIRPGGQLMDIGFAISKYAEENGFSVVKDYTGHGIGRIFHQKPTICHYPNPETNVTIEPGMFFTVEPMINEGIWETELDSSDGWTVYTQDRKLSAQFEHTIFVTDNGVEILT